MKKLFHHPHSIPLLLFFFFTALYFSSTVGGMNSGDGTFYALTQSLVEEQRIEIDSYRQWTYRTDYVFRNDHYYMDREPGTAVIGIPFYLMAKPLSKYAALPYNGNHPAVTEESKTQALTYLATCVLSALGIVLVFQIAKLLQPSYLSAFLTAISVGVGTLLWKYSYSYYREPLVTTFFLGAYYCFLLFIHKQKTRYLFLMGLLLGTALFHDYSKIYLLPIFGAFTFFVLRKRVKNLLFPALGLAVPLFFIFLYNYSAFQNIFANPHSHKTYFVWMQNPAHLFQAPLLLSLAVNLFSTSPIPAEALPFFWEHPAIAYQMGASWATVWPYKGIFIQTPLLILAIVGLGKAAMRQKLAIGLLGTIATVIILVMAKHTVFWGGNVYDTRYFLTASVFLLLGLSIWLHSILITKSPVKKIMGIGITFLCFIFSLNHGWSSALTHFAPNVSGEHRFAFTQLLSPFSQHVNTNIALLISQTFPNMYNLPILILAYFPVFLLLYLVIFRPWKRKTKRHTHHETEKKHKS